MILQSARLWHEKKHLTPWHQHTSGQIYLLTHGMIALETQEQQWAMTAGSIGWLPPHCAHQALACGNVAGWSLYLPEPYCSELPEQPHLSTASGLIQALVERIALFAGQSLNAPQRRLLQVLRDEVRMQENTPLQLPLPQDARLLKIARALLNEPADNRTQSEWAAWAGLSTRTLSRRFINETGMTFARWRQQARVIRSLEPLSRGEAVNRIAAECGYDNVSAYIAAFRQRFGTTPGLYFVQRETHFREKNEAAVRRN
ncbi:helix-turn-helix domain-containing protein [Serratia quinivorans]|uniref:helix-turn-helix domain-containing protein n=1 Tax=Serratia quinivorans TaxID=137545 RepID=UPI002179570F|nr:HTH-type transcriptional repressor of iron proteins A [Serratia quinivorans]CAI1082378.1 HTH-type transcriptional repressor of iron proteins A [Serratia quinivorans]CAI1131436.1 HTH-type transcriptional repressor of iron proteins A [Serratia quinivorans]CAI1584524.1 HTH-type transcriptional repressor of iron proteins A [Serratia quinivorans]CAI2077259.1 HTH-type transcriptional repressor of iron proteins A [Serratia quinivorans]